MTRRVLSRGFGMVVILELALAPLAGPSLSAEELEPLGVRQTRIFSQICATCHVQPGSGAPLIGHPDDWKDRREGGVERLVRNTVDGYRDMPPLGTCGFCNEQDFRILVSFMAATGSGDPASTKEPR